MFLTTYVTSWFKRAWCKKAVNSARQVERIQHFTHLLADPNREAERGEVYLSQCFRHAPWTIRVRRSRRKNRSAGCGFLSPWELDTKNFKKVQKGIPCVVAIASFWVVLVASFVWYFLVICIHWLDAGCIVWRGSAPPMWPAHYLLEQRPKPSCIRFILGLN